MTIVRIKRLACLAALTTGALVSSTRNAGAQEQFGSRGQVVLNSTGTSLSGLFGTNPTVLTPFLSFGQTSSTTSTVDTPIMHSETTQKVTSLIINPGIDVFVIDRLSIGGEVAIGKAWASDKTVTKDVRSGVETTTTDDGPSPTTFGFMPRVGYSIPIGQHFSIWPRGGLGFVTSSYSQPAGPTGGTVDVSRTATLFFVDVPFMWHPSDKFFVGLGPGFSRTLSNSEKAGDVSRDPGPVTTFRFLSFSIGGVLN